MKANTPIKIGSKIAKNRITMAPTVKFAAKPGGLVTDEFVRHYEARAAHQCGFICVEATCISEEGRLHPSQLGLWCDNQIEGHKKIADACHKHGALVVPQLHHGGLRTHVECGSMVGPTKMMHPRAGQMEEVKELSKEEIKTIQNQFVMAAVRAKKAGYDGVQLHGCHYYLINNFASDLNQRTDEYGGSPENRARFGSEIIAGIREACGKDFIISMRISGYDPTLADSFTYADCYVGAGCNYLQVSDGVAKLDNYPHDEALPYNKVASLGICMHEHMKGRVPVSLVNGLRTPEQVNYLLENDLIDTVDLACGLLADPAFTEAILATTPTETTIQKTSAPSYVKCFNCPDCGYGPNHHICPAAKKRGVYEFGAVGGNLPQYDSAKVEFLGENPLKDVPVLFLGSSVTYGECSDQDGIPEYFAKRLGCISTKEAISGTTLVDEDETSYVSRLKNRVDPSTKFGLVICQLSTNDASKKKPLGEITGAIEEIIAYCKSTWNCPVMFYTGSRYESQDYQAMVDRLYEIAKKWGIGVLDLWKDDDFNKITDEERALYMSDPIHPTKAGYMKWWCPELERQLLAQLHRPRVPK